MGHRYAILGAGRQGLAAAYDILRFGDAEEVLLIDRDRQTLNQGEERLKSLLNTSRVKSLCRDIQDSERLRQALGNVQAAVSAVPYPFNLAITQAAIAAGCSLCDLGGHTETTREQLKMDDDARNAGVTITPDCGMGPGLNVSMGVRAMSLIQEPQEVFIWDGGLPQNPEPPWNYQSTFHIKGLVNEYSGSAYFIRDGKVTPVPCITEIETLEFDPPLGRLEAAVTSGGLSTAPWSFAGKLLRLENKTLRYPGHWEWFKAYRELGLFDENPVSVNGSHVSPREVFHSLLERKIASDALRDICVIRVQCNGESDGETSSCALELIETYDEATGFTAMEKLTGWHASMIAILSAKGDIPRGGIPVEIALTPGQLTEEAGKRGWVIKTQIARNFLPQSLR